MSSARVRRRGGRCPHRPLRVRRPAGFPGELAPQRVQVVLDHRAEAPAPRSRRSDANPARCRTSSSGASRTRTDDLLGAIQLDGFTKLHLRSPSGYGQPFSPSMVHLVSSLFALRVRQKCVTRRKQASERPRAWYGQRRGDASSLLASPLKTPLRRIQSMQAWFCVTLLLFLQMFASQFGLSSCRSNNTLNRAVFSAM
jgi:hypothetical protein